MSKSANRLSTTLQVSERRRAGLDYATTSQVVEELLLCRQTPLSSRRSSYVTAVSDGGFNWSTARSVRRESLTDFPPLQPVQSRKPPLPRLLRSYTMDGARSPLTDDGSNLARDTVAQSGQFHKHAKAEDAKLNHVIAQSRVGAAQMRLPEKGSLTSPKFHRPKLPWLRTKPASSPSTAQRPRLDSQHVPGSFVSENEASPAEEVEEQPLTLLSPVPEPMTPRSPKISKPEPRLQSRELKKGATSKWIHEFIHTDGHRSSVVSTEYSPSNYSNGPVSDASDDTVIPATRIPLTSYEKLVVKPADLDDSTQKPQDAIPANAKSNNTKEARNLPLTTRPRRSHTIHISPKSSEAPVRVNTGISTAESFQSAIESFEDLMEEAISVAKDAAQKENDHEARRILEEASKAMQDAETIVDRRLSAITMSPLQVSDYTPTSSETSSMQSSRSSTKNGKRSYETMLTVDSRESRPVVIEPYQKEGKAPSSEQAEVVELERPQVRFESDNRHHPSDGSHLETPPRFSKPSHESIVIDWAYVKKESKDSLSSSVSTTSSLRKRTTAIPMRRISIPLESGSTQSGQREQVGLVVRALPSREAVQEHIEKYNKPPDIPRHSSKRHSQSQPDHVFANSSRPVLINRRPIIEDPPRNTQVPQTGFADKEFYDSNGYPLIDRNTPGLSLKHKNHFSLRDRQGFSLGRSHRHKPIARNWSTAGKRIAATVACINTALVGILIGIYAGLVPAIQYMIADEQHLAILGNTVLFLGLAITTFFFWPLPLLHGRKPYTLAALALVLPLQFPQALSVDSPKSPLVANHRVGLLLSRAISGFALGFAHMNFKSTLFDLFGSSLQSANPHQEFVLNDDVRRHGGGMGLWLGIWSWCFIGSLAVGFLIGAGIIANLNPSWGFYITVILIAGVLVLDVIAPETRRNPYRRTVAEITNADESISRRVARGEVSMHVEGTGPKNWKAEVGSGVRLSLRMLRQVGFAVLAVYLGWIYAQVVLIIVLLGALLSREYQFRSQYVGLGVLSVAIGAFLAVPLAKASLFSRARSQGPRTDSMTFQPRVTWSSHLVRRVIFMITLPFAGMAYTIASAGPHINFMLPIVFAGVIGFLSNLAIAECHGLIMETFDTSDLQPGVNSKHRLASMASNTRRRRTNYSSFPRVSSGIFISQTFAFVFAAVATAVGGRVIRRTGAQAATGIVAGILLALTILLILVLWRWKEVQVIPNDIFGTQRRHGRESVATTTSVDSWRAVVIGNPSGKMRRMSILELGAMSRWTEIRKLNRLIRESESWR